MPLGICLETYTSHSTEFSLYYNTLTSPRSVQLFQNLQSLSYWFIDGASEIIVTEDSPHRWLVLTLYASVDQYPCLAGFCLLYVFSNPFQSPPHSLRLCQILILPPFQKQGHSGRILGLVYRTLLHTPLPSLLPQSYPGGNESLPWERSEECTFSMLTMEDPCEECTFVRDVFDCRLLRSLEAMQSYMQQTGEGEVMPLSRETVESVRKSVGIMEEQLQKCYNLLLHHMFAVTSKSYRVYVGSWGEMVKERLKSRSQQRGEMNWS